MTTGSQREFAIRLYTDLQKVAPSLSEKDATIVAETVEINKDGLAKVLQGEGDIGLASRMIDVLKSLVEDSKNRAGIIEYRWTKAGEDWVIKGPDLTEGKEVVVTSKKGEKRVMIASVADGFGYPAREEKEKPPIDLEEGVYINNDGDLIEVALTRNNQLVGKMIDPNTGRREYLGKRGLLHLERKLTLDEAKEFGHNTGVCVNCGRELTNPESILLGLGPVCASKF